MTTLTQLTNLPRHDIPTIGVAIRNGTATQEELEAYAVFSMEQNVPAAIEEAITIVTQGDEFCGDFPVVYPERITVAVEDDAVAGWHLDSRKSFEGGIDKDGRPVKWQAEYVRHRQVGGTLYLTFDVN